MIEQGQNTNKYHNKRVKIDGMFFDSTKEGERYKFLKLLERLGEITALKRQVRFELIPKITHEEVVHLKTKDKVVTKTDQLPINYTADFTYTIVKTGEEVVEDVKGRKDLYSADVPLRLKLFYWKYGKRVKIVTKARQDIITH